MYMNIEWSNKYISYKIVYLFYLLLLCYNTFFNFKKFKRKECNHNDPPLPPSNNAYKCSSKVQYHKNSYTGSQFIVR